MFELKNKVIVVTGGAGLLGSEFSLAIAKAGGTVIIADINRDAAELVANKIRKLGLQAISIVTDITSQHNIDMMIEQLDAKYGRIDAVINNAYPRNHNYGSKLEEVSYKDFCENINLHLGGYFNVSQRFAVYFSKQNFGNIINMSSIYGLIAPRFEIYKETMMTMPVEYAAVKSGINQLSRYFAKYFKKKNIRCNTLSVGGIEDNQEINFMKKYNELCCSKGMLVPADIIGGLLFLLSDESLYMNGHNLVIDDGFTL